jgi:hypothetical protein
MRVIIFVSSILLILLFGCATPARYSYDEIKDYPADVQQWIMKGEVAIGMTPQQVRYAWGSPASIKVLEPIDGKSREEWIYTTMGVFGTRIILFIDGKVAYISGETHQKK